MERNIAPYNRNNYTEQDDEIDLYEILDVILRRKAIIIITTIIGTILSIVGSTYYSKNMVKEKYAQKITIDYGVINDPLIISIANLHILPIMSILNDDRVVEELFSIEQLEDIYSSNKKSTTNESEIIKKREFLEGIVDIIPIVDKQNEISFELKKYSVSVNIKKNKTLSEEVIDKFIDIIQKKVNEEFTVKLGKLDEFNKKNLSEYRENLEKNENFESGNEIINMRLEDIDSIIKFSNPALYVSINENIKRYHESSDINNKIKLIEEKLKNNDILQKNDSIYKINTRNYSLIILIIGSVFGFFLGILLAFICEFLDNYKKRKVLIGSINKTKYEE